MEDNWLRILLGTQAFGASPEYETAAMRYVLVLGFIGGFILGINL